MEQKVFFRSQYGTISKMVVILALVILTIYLFRGSTPQQEASSLGRTASSYITVAAFLLGAACSEVAGYVGMLVPVRGNARVFSAVRRSAREALQIAVRAGGLSAIIVVGMAVMGVTVLYATSYVWLGVGSPGSMKVTGFRCWKYTKATNVEADLVGKVEQGIPEDDPRNLAVIADLIEYCSVDISPLEAGDC